MSVQQVLPLTLVGYAAAAVVSHIDPGTGKHIAIPIIYTGIAIQGMGILVSLLVSLCCRTSYHSINPDGDPVPRGVRRQPIPLLSSGHLG